MRILGTLISVFLDLRNVQSAEALISIEKIWGVKDLINREKDKGIEAMEGIITKNKIKTGFLYCPRCGLRKPKNEIFGYYGGYCPSCGTRMVEERQMPYYSKEYESRANHILFFR